MKQNRRAPGTSAGVKSDIEESSLWEVAGFSPAAGDPIACRSAVKKRNRLSNSASSSLRALRSLQFLGRVCVDLRSSALSAVFPGRGFSAHLCDLWAVWVGGQFHCPCESVFSRLFKSENIADLRLISS